MTSPDRTHKPGKASWLLHNRFAIQVASLVLANSFVLRGFRGFCYPVLNCWSCPGANFACPIGMLQASSSEAGYTLRSGGLRALWVALPLWTLGTLIVFSAFFGRMMCGWLCPFGWVQDVVGRLRRRRWSIPRPLRYLRYVILFGVVFVVAYYAHLPWFCKLCPMGALEGGLLQPLTRPELRPLIQQWWWLKQAILLLVLVAAVFWRRPFCSTVCPLGAIFSLFSRVSAWQVRWDEDTCVNCEWCVRNCPQGIDPRHEVGSHACIGCLECQKCPFDAIYSAPRWSEGRGCASPAAADTPEAGG